MKPIRRNHARPIIWKMRSNSVYLTFDDGPDPEMTPRLLDLFARLHCRATFFVVGEKVRRHPAILERLASEGHAVGNHSFSHQRLLFKPQTTIRFEIEQTDSAVQNITGETPKLFRPPFGQFGVNTFVEARRAGHQMVLWSASGKDYLRAMTDRDIAARLLRLVGGKIVLLHDGHPNSGATISALAATLPRLIDAGMTFEPLTPNHRAAI